MQELILGLIASLTIAVSYFLYLKTIETREQMMKELEALDFEEDVKEQAPVKVEPVESLDIPKEPVATAPVENAEAPKPKKKKKYYPKKPKSE